MRRFVRTVSESENVDPSKRIPPLPATPARTPAWRFDFRPSDGQPPCSECPRSEHSSVPTVLRVKPSTISRVPSGSAIHFVVELVRACRDAAVAFAGIDHSGVAAVHQLEEMVFRLAVLARIADQHLRQLGVLDAVFLLAAFAERAAVEADDRRMAEIGVDAVEAGGVGDRHIDSCSPMPSPSP